jgi:Reverse transcriptase (RNA-dependent DNA polymerase)
MDQWAAVGPTGMTPRHLQLLLHARASATAGMNGIWSLTRLVCRNANGKVPDSVLPRISAARVVRIRKPKVRIGPVAIGNILQSLVTKALLPAAIAFSGEFIYPEQVCNGVRSGADALVYETREFQEEYDDDDEYVLVPIDARNAFNVFSLQKMLYAAREYAPNVVRWINLIYGKQQRLLVIGSHKFPSQEGAQQGDPAAMLLFSLVIQPLPRKISDTCVL